MTDPYKWATPIMLTDGHRLFPWHDDPFKRVAIADESGREPQNCTDGVLWLDTLRPLMIVSDRGKESFLIPLLGDESGEVTRTISNASTLLFLSATFNWPIVDQPNHHTVYTVTER